MLIFSLLIYRFIKHGCAFFHRGLAITTKTMS
nr:MAG TPA: hypothetical protein [Caudoviricetes sp.]